MIPRRVYQTVREALARQAAVALIGPRQVGKTTLAHELVDSREALYLDLEAREDRDKLVDPALFLRLVILDEIHRAPELIRGSARHSMQTIGNVWVDRLRSANPTNPIGSFVSAA